MSVRVVGALSLLTDREREVVIERVIREQEYGEIAVTIGCCEKTARDTYAKAMKKLRYHLEDMREDL